MFAYKMNLFSDFIGKACHQKVVLLSDSVGVLMELHEDVCGFVRPGRRRCGDARVDAPACV